MYRRKPFQKVSDSWNGWSESSLLSVIEFKVMDSYLRRWLLLLYVRQGGMRRWCCCRTRRGQVLSVFGLRGIRLWHLLESFIAFNKSCKPVCLLVKQEAEERDVLDCWNETSAHHFIFHSWSHMEVSRRRCIRVYLSQLWRCDRNICSYHIHCTRFDKDDSSV